MSAKETTLDLRELGCGQRHGLVFQCLSVLEPGFSIVLINDHDPEPLRRQLLAEYGERLSWKLERIAANEFKATIHLQEPTDN